jgi:hypothetical protein
MYVLPPSLFEWLNGRGRRPASILADADRLIARFNDQAYFEARERVKGRCLDGDVSPRYWAKVKREIARRQGIEIGLAGADTRALNRIGRL